MYSLEDLVVFNVEGWFGLYQTVNAKYWPLHIVGVLWGGLTLSLFLLQKKYLFIVAVAGASILWFSCALVFHFGEYKQLSWVAVYYGWAFIAEAILLLCVAVFWHGSIISDLGKQKTLLIRAGYFLLVLGVLLVPMLGFFDGRNGASLDIVGIGPDSTALATLGLALICVRKKILRIVLCAIPTIWLIFSAATAWPMGLFQGVVGLCLWLLIIFYLLKFNTDLHSD